MLEYKVCIARSQASSRDPSRGKHRTHGDLCSLNRISMNKRIVGAAMPPTSRLAMPPDAIPGATGQAIGMAFIHRECRANLPPHPIRTEASMHPEPWLPIWSAPKDGRQILVGDPDRGVSFRVAWAGDHWASDGVLVPAEFPAWRPVPDALAFRLAVGLRRAVA